MKLKIEIVTLPEKMDIVLNISLRLSPKAFKILKDDRFKCYLCNSVGVTEIDKGARKDEINLALKESGSKVKIVVPVSNSKGSLIELL